MHTANSTVAVVCIRSTRCHAMNNTNNTALSLRNGHQSARAPCLSHLRDVFVHQFQCSGQRVVAAAVVDYERHQVLGKHVLHEPNETRDRVLAGFERLPRTLARGGRENVVNVVCVIILHVSHKGGHVGRVEIRNGCVGIGSGPAQVHDSHLPLRVGTTT